MTTAWEISNSPLEWVVAVREGIQKGRLFGPRLYVIGRRISTPVRIEGYKTQIGKIYLDFASTEEEARRLVRERAALGVDGVKVTELVPKELILAITDEAHKAGMIVTGHANDVYASILGGMDAVEHDHAVAMTVLSPAKREEVTRARDTGKIRNEEVYQYMDPALFDDVVRLFTEHGAYWTLTIAKRFRALSSKADFFARYDEKLLQDPNLAYIPLHEQALVRGHFASFKRLPEDKVAAIRAGYQNVLEFARRFVRAGGRLRIGSDPYGALPAVSMHEEMAMLVHDAGIAPMKVIQAVTQTPAQLLKIDKDLGTLETGKLADLFVVRGDPLKEITATFNVEMVMKDGKTIDTRYHADFKDPFPHPENAEELPVIDTISPKWIVAGDAAEISIEGKAFQPSALVFFDGKPVPVKNRKGKTLITAALTPEQTGAAGTHEIKIIHPEGWNFASNPAFIIVRYR